MGAVSFNSLSSLSMAALLIFWLYACGSLEVGQEGCLQSTPAKYIESDVCIPMHLRTQQKHCHLQLLHDFAVDFSRHLLLPVDPLEDVQDFAL